MRDGVSRSKRALPPPGRKGVDFPSASPSPELTGTKRAQNARLLLDITQKLKSTFLSIKGDALTENMINFSSFFRLIMRWSVKIVMKSETRSALEQLICQYNQVMQVMETRGKDSDEEGTRAYGGVIRAMKGKLQEFISEKLIEIAWGHELGQSRRRLDINSDKIPIPLKPEYLNRIPKYLKDHISSNISDYNYKLSVDKHAFIDGKFVLGIECKAYTENAMIKRIMVDFMFLKTKYPNLKCFLFQLESQLTGDYSELKPCPLGSRPTHSIMSYFDTVDLNILTLIKGERKVDRPINKPQYFKPLEMSSLEKGIFWLTEAMKDYVK